MNQIEDKNKIRTFEYGNIEILFCDSTHELPLHSHDSWCIGMVLGGEVMFEINHQQRILNKGMLFNIPSNTGVKITPVKKYSYVTICLKNELRKKFMDYGFDQYFLNLNGIEELMDIIHEYMWTKNEGIFIDDLLKLIMPLLCVDSLKKHHDVSEPVRKAISFMKEHANGKFDLEELASQAYVSKYHLVRQFKKEMGVSPHQYYLQIKIRMAKKGILENKSEIEIASELNFSDQSHLCRQFKQMMGVSLQDYKKNVIKP